LSGVLPAYPDEDDNKDQKTWGHGEPEHDKVRGLEQSIKHIFNTLDQNGPFSGIIGFSSGAAMAAIVASLLEKRKTLCGIPWKVIQVLPIHCL
jgi:surfactin synthase thioesterase subunit